MCELKKPLDVRLEEMKVRNGGIDVTLQSPIVLMAMQSLVDLYHSTDGANNYLSVVIMDKKTNEWFEVTIQRKNGKTPSEAVALLYAELDELKKSAQQ